MFINKDGSVAKTQKVITLEVKCESNKNGREEITDHGHVDTAAIAVILNVHPDEVSEGQLTDINEEIGCHRKDEDILEELT